MLAFITLNLIVLAAWAFAVVWLILAVMTLRNLTRQKPLGAAPPRRSDEKRTPLVSVLVPARNEEGRVLTHSLRSMLAQDYDRFEVIAVNDRSTDGTGSILNAIAKADERLTVIEGTDTPPGWLGKPHALQQALDLARGEWVLATDADMIFHESALRSALDHAIAGDYDAVTLVPHIETRTFWERVFAPIFGWFMSIGMPIERVNDPRRREAIAVGGFFLIRRKELRRLDAYRAVRADVAEDLRLAQLMKQSGSRLRIEYAPNLASTRMYAGLAEIWSGFSKNFFAGMEFSLLRTLASVIGVLVFMVAPIFIAILCTLAWAFGIEGPWLRIGLPMVATFVIQVLTFACINRYARVPLGYSFTVPLGFALFVAILVNSTFRIATGRGVVWKDRIVYDRASAIYPSRPGRRARRPVTDD